MPPILAAFLTMAFVGYLFRRDIRQRPNVTAALWLPFIWMFLIFSRAVSQWLGMFGVRLGGISLEEGSPLDATVYLVLICAGIYVLIRRGTRIQDVIHDNAWPLLFVFCCFIAIFWSDLPFVAFKRWIKILGHPIMVLILLTEPVPVEAVERLMKRCAYIVLPVSILFIKYYPQWGRRYTPWGASILSGITTGKNLLGADCWVLGLFLFWYSWRIWRGKRDRHRRDELVLCVTLLAMLSWLLYRADSKTSIGCLILGIATILILQRRFIDEKFIAIYVVAAIAIFAVAQTLFSVSDYVVAFLGRNSTLTGRTDLWKELLKIHTNPLIGVGFESFWLGKTAQQLQGHFFFIPNEAHNGYLEIYLNMGLFGLLVLAGVLVATFFKICSEFQRNLEWAQYRLAFFAAILLYNWTESAFRSLHPVWFGFYLIAMEYSGADFFFPQANSLRANGQYEPAFLATTADDCSVTSRAI